MEYIAWMIFLIVGYFCGLFWIRRIKNPERWNLPFCAVIFVLYAIDLIEIYKSVGFYDWNFTNSLPTANVSPFTFTCVGLSFLFPKKIRYRFLTLISMLSVGMFIAGVLECVNSVFEERAFNRVIATDSTIHLIISLYGVFLIAHKQVSVDTKNVLVSGIMLVCVALCMLILNVIFRTSFFGLSVYGEHNIYGVVFSKSGTWSALLYFTGLCAVLLLGSFCQKTVARKAERIPL